MRPASQDERSQPETVLVTGFPAFTARRMIAKVLSEDTQARLFLLSRDKFVLEAKEFTASLPEEQRSRIEVLEGDVCSMDLGLSGSEFRRITGQVTTIHHLAGIYYLGVDRETAKRVNVGGTRGILELADESKKLRRLCHWSTASVSGKRRGVVLEEELDEGQHFHNFYEETKCAAEKLARSAQRRLPITIVRPGIIVGDSTTGEIDKFDGPYYLIMLIAGSSQLRVPMPGRGSAPLHLVPIDYVIDAAYALTMDERAAGLTFHLTDPRPMSARQIFELIAELSGKRLAKNNVPLGVTRTLLRTPILSNAARAPRSFLEAINQRVTYSTNNTARLLRGSGIECPSFDSYAPQLLSYIKSVREARAREVEELEVFDPFD
jgi:thioester reductase-like protein